MATSAENPFPTSSVDTLPEDTYVSGEGMAGSAPTDTPLRSKAQSDLLARVVQGAHDTIDRLAETAAPHVQKLQDGVASANEKLHSRADHARDVGDEWTDSLRTTVRENPIAAVATALAVGLLVARLTR